MHALIFATVEQKTKCDTNYCNVTTYCIKKYIYIPETYVYFRIHFLTGNLLNIKDAYAHPMFYRGIDDSTGFRTRYFFFNSSYFLNDVEPTPCKSSMG